MTNKVCVIIGGGSGMGAAVAKEMNKRKMPFTAFCWY